MERLSKLFGFDFIITLRAIDPERYADIQKMAVDFTNGSADNIDIYQMQTQTLLAGIADPDLKNKDLLEKFGAVLCLATSSASSSWPARLPTLRHRLQNSTAIRPRKRRTKP
jgi:hypothetical protein